MAIECERKFLVEPGEWESAPAVSIRQGYLSRDPERTVRVRLADTRATLTIKGLGEGIARAEYEYDIPPEDAAALLAVCLPEVVEKRRHTLRVGAHRWEVDVFGGANAGLILAEIELSDERETFLRPPWLGREVTGDPRYYNASLSRTPFSQWSV